MQNKNKGQYNNITNKNDEKSYHNREDVDPNKTQIISKNDIKKQKFIICKEAQETYAHVSTVSYRGAHLCLRKHRGGVDNIIQST